MRLKRSLFILWFRDGWSRVRGQSMTKGTEIWVISQSQAELSEQTVSVSAPLPKTTEHFTFPSHLCSNGTSVGFLKPSLHKSTLHIRYRQENKDELAGWFPILISNIKWSLKLGLSLGVFELYLREYYINRLLSMFGVKVPSSLFQPSSQFMYTYCPMQWGLTRWHIQYIQHNTREI